MRDSALVAAQRIHDRHQRMVGPGIDRCVCGFAWPCNTGSNHDAGVVVERIRLAAEHLQAIIERSAPSRPHHDPGDDYRDAAAALAALTGDTHA